MKKIYLLALSLSLFSLGMLAQTPTFEIQNNDNSNIVVVNNEVFTKSVAALATHQSNFTIKNISATSQTINVRKYEDLLNTVSVSDKAEAVFCTGTTCYPPNIFTSSVVLSAGETIAFKADITEASIIGESNVRYKFTNANDANETISFTTKYNVPASVLKHTATFGSVSSVYPNPTNSNSFININAIDNTKDVKLNIINALGSVVNSKTIELNKGKNLIQLETENLNAGVYFISVSNKESIITRKITVTK